MRVFLILFLFCSLSLAGEQKPKYGSKALPLSRNHTFFSKATAPDYWALIPYYAAQRDDRSCSLASITMIINAARAKTDLTSEQPLATQDAVLKRSKSASWEKSLGTLGRGVTLDQLGEIARQSLASYGFQSKIEVLHAEANSETFKKRLHQILLENEKTADDFIIANFDQKIFTGDASVGHIAPVAAFDREKRQVLILDPDRQWYEPYWVSEDVFAEGLSTRDMDSGQNRGILWVRLKR